MELLVTIIHMSVALFMILVVLVQGGNQGGIGAAFGGGNSQGVFGAGGATTFLGKLTYGAAIIFMFTSITLTILQGKGGNVGLSERLRAQSTASQQEAKPAVSPDEAKTEEKKAIEHADEEALHSADETEDLVVPEDLDDKKPSLHEKDK